MYDRGGSDPLFENLVLPTTAIASVGDVQEGVEGKRDNPVLGVG